MSMFRVRFLTVMIRALRWESLLGCISTSRFYVDGWLERCHRLEYRVVMLSWIIPSLVRESYPHHFHGCLQGTNRPQPSQILYWGHFSTRPLSSRIYSNVVAPHDNTQYFTFFFFKKKSNNYFIYLLASVFLSDTSTSGIDNRPHSSLLSLALTTWETSLSSFSQNSLFPRKMLTPTLEVEEGQKSPSSFTVFCPSRLQWSFLVAQSSLRALAAASTLVALSIMVTSEESVVIFGIRLEAHYYYSSAFRCFLKHLLQQYLISLRSDKWDQAFILTHKYCFFFHGFCWAWVSLTLFWAD